MNFERPVIKLMSRGFKAYCKKRDLHKVMSTLRGEE